MKMVEKIENFENMWKKFLKIQHAIKDVIEKGDLEGKETVAILKMELDAIYKELFSPKSLEINAKAYDKKAKERKGQTFEKAKKVHAARDKATYARKRRTKVNVFKLLKAFKGNERVA